MRAAVIGGNGALGSDIVQSCRARGWTTTVFTHDELCVEDAESVRNALLPVAPEVIFNTAASHNVPQCEKNPARAFAVNGAGAWNVARIADELGAVVVYYSTDYVFDGTKGSPYVENDLPNPLNIYAATKLVGEHVTLNYARRPLVIRISGIYGAVPCRAKGGNFVTTMIKAAREKPEVRVVNDEILSPTPTAVIAERSLDLVEGRATGLFHLASEGHCSWFDFAETIFRIMGFTTPLLPCSARDFPSVARRPAFSALANGRLRALGRPEMPTWQEGITTFLQKEYARA